MRQTRGPRQRFVLVGAWTLRGNDHRFDYDSTWPASENSRPLSLLLPFRQGSAPFTGQRFAKYFDNLLPHSIDIRNHVAKRFGVASTKAFDLIERIGRDCMAAVQMRPAGSAPPNVRRVSAQPLSEATIEKLLDDTVAEQGLGAADDGLRISLAGAQEKTAPMLHKGKWCLPKEATPTTHLLNLPLGQVGGARADLSTSVENEWLCSRLASFFGLRTAFHDISQDPLPAALEVPALE